MALGVGVPLAWGKPVQTSEHPRMLSGRYSLRTIRLMISVAGPAMNLLLALAMSLVFVVAARLRVGMLIDLALLLVQLNLGLMFFNLLPVPPLDGRSFLAFLPDSLAVVRDGLMKYGGFIFLALVFLGGIGQGPSPLQYIMTPFTLISRAYVHLLVQLGGLG
jgi:Zn-dependent protease